MKTSVKRVYDYTETAGRSAILVDRLWPRGINKEKLKGVVWLKILTPSSELRSWFHQDKVARHDIFSKKYLAELEANKGKVEIALSDLGEHLTLLTAVKDIECSHIPTLQTFLKKL